MNASSTAARPPSSLANEPSGDSLHGGTRRRKLFSIVVLVAVAGIALAVGKLCLWFVTMG